MSYFEKVIIYFDTNIQISPHPEIGLLARFENEPSHNSTHMNLEKMPMSQVYIVRYCASDGGGPEFSRC